MYFYPRSPCGERHKPNKHQNQPRRFLSTLSLRRATRSDTNRPCKPCISIHALLAESDGGTDGQNAVILGISIHALLAESDRLPRSGTARGTYFYPRSPCGERLAVPDLGKRNVWISIHALLAESDGVGLSSCSGRIIFLSTLSLRRATYSLRQLQSALRDFYPRSPCGERHNINSSVNTADKISIHALLAESD